VDIIVSASASRGGVSRRVYTCSIAQHDHAWTLFLIIGSLAAVTSRGIGGRDLICELSGSRGVI
jgi:hypothetical protein